jgi:hypothetical protein
MGTARQQRIEHIVGELGTRVRNAYSGLLV